MTEAQRKRAEAIFRLIRDRPSVEHADCLRAACPDDAEVRDEVEALLESYAQAGSFLETPPASLEDLPATSEPSPHAEGPGTIISQFKLLQRLGEGGMGTVYAAEQSYPVRRKVAFKICKEGMDSRRVIARFEAERQALALMDHSNIARVFDAGTTDTGRPYFVMELVHGMPITDFCDEHRLAPHERLELMIPVCHAIQHAHHKGIIHRDIKPSNVLVAPSDGRPVPKVIDFGVAKAMGQPLTEKTMFTEFGQLVGTLEYMSPEQASMTQCDVDTRSDVYALGVLLYELLTGTPPISPEELREAGFAEMLQMIRESIPMKPSTRITESGALRASISARRRSDPVQLSRFLCGDLDWIVMKALEKERDRRYATASDLAADIRRFISHQAVEAGPPSMTYRTRKFIQRHRVSVLSAMLIGAALLIGMSVSVFFGLRASYQTGRADASDIAKVRAEKMARERDYDTGLLLANTAWNQSNMTWFLELLNSRKPQSAEQDLRGFEWDYWQNLYRRNQAIIAVDQNSNRAIAFSPDGKLLASGSGGTKATDAGELCVRNAETGQVIHRFGFSTRVLSIAFSHDGTMLAAGSGNAFNTGQVKIWQIGAEPKLILHCTELPGQVNGIDFSSDDNLLAFGGSFRSQTGFLQVWNVNSRDQVFEASTEPIEDLCFGPAGRLATVGTVSDEGGKVICWKVAPDGRQLVEDFTLSTRSDSATALAFSPNGQRLVVATRGGPLEHAVKVWKLETGREDIYPMSGHTGAIQDVCFSPDGEQIASASFDRTVKVWDAKSGQELLTLRGHANSVSAVAFNPDPKKNRLVSGGRSSIRSWSTELDQGVVTLRGHTAGLQSVAFHPSGKIVASSGDDGTARVWDISTSRQLTALAEFKGIVMGVAFSPNGKVLATASGEWSKPGDIHIWDWENQQILHHFRGHTVQGAGVDFHPDGQLVASVAGGWGILSNECKLWDLRTGAELEFPVKRPSGFVNSVDFSPDGQLVAWGGADAENKEGVWIWNLQQRQQVRQLTGDTGAVIRVAFSNDSNLIATGNFDHTITSWDVQTGEEQATLEGHGGRVHCVAFSRDDRRVVSSGQDGTFKLWNVTTGQQVLSIEHPPYVWSVAFSPQGDQIASAGMDGTVKIWDGMRDSQLTLPSEDSTVDR